jgi:hypothetical protein
LSILNRIFATTATCVGSKTPAFSKKRLANLYVVKDEVYRSPGYATYFEDFTLAPYVDPALLQGFAPNAIHIVTLAPNALVTIQAQLAEALVEKLAAYEPAGKSSRKSHFYHFDTIHYQGVTYELEVKWHKLHEEISNLFHSWEATSKALADGARYQFYFKRGITHRDDALLRDLNYPTPSAKTVDQLVQHYRGVLTEQEVYRTLVKLEAMQCLTLASGSVTITQAGRNIV